MVKYFHLLGRFPHKNRNLSCWDFYHRFLLGPQQYNPATAFATEHPCRRSAVKVAFKQEGGGLLVSSNFNLV